MVAIAGCHFIRWSLFAEGLSTLQIDKPKAKKAICDCEETLSTVPFWGGLVGFVVC